MARMRRRRNGKRKTSSFRRGVRQRGGFKRFRGKRAFKRQRRAARKSGFRNGYYAAKLAIQEGEVTSTGGTTTAAALAIQPVALSDQLTEWCARANDFLGFSALAGVYKQFRIRGFSLTFRPNWGDNDIANQSGGGAQAAADIPLFRYMVNRDPAALPDAAATGAGEVLANRIGCKTHNFSRGRPLRIYCKWPLIPEYINAANYTQGSPEGGQWTQDDQIYAQGRPRWFPTNQAAARVAEHLGILTAFDQPWVPTAMSASQPIIRVSAKLWVEFKDAQPGYLSVAP